MPLQEPPRAATSLADLPAEPLAGRTVFRVWRPRDAVSRSPWWFASAPRSEAAVTGGRYDLPEPMGTCYTATQRVGAVLEALQGFLLSLPRAELAARLLATMDAPADAPAAADVSANSAAGAGITAALWAGGDRALTQRWAAALRRDGWWAIFSGLQHDPSGRLRGHALFDSAGAHAPTHGSPWRVRTTRLVDEPELSDELQRYGIAPRDPGDLPVIEPHV